MKKIKENKEFFNQKVGKRLRECLDQITDVDGKRVSYGVIADNIGCTKEHLSQVLNGHKALTDDLADSLIRVYLPDVRKAYLLCMDDDKTDHDISINALKKSMFEGNSMLLGLVAFGKLSGFEFDIYDPDQDGRDAIKAVQNFSFPYTVKKDGRSVKISIDEMNQLQNEISDFIEFKLNKLF